MTEAEYRNFIKNQLRGSTRKWAPISECKKKARVGFGEYLCASCGQVVPPTIFDEDKGKRVTNIFVDHIDPIIDPAVGWVSWDSTVERMFCEADNLQCLCGACHKEKSLEEIGIAKARRAKEKQDGE